MYVYVVATAREGRGHECPDLVGLTTGIGLGELVTRAARSVGIPVDSIPTDLGLPGWDDETEHGVWSGGEVLRNDDDTAVVIVWRLA